MYFSFYISDIKPYREQTSVVLFSLLLLLWLKVKQYKKRRNWVGERSLWRISSIELNEIPHLDDEQRCVAYI